MTLFIIDIANKFSSKRSTSNIKIQKVLDEKGMKAIVYIRDSVFATKDRIVNLDPTVITQWEAYIN